MKYLMLLTTLIATSTHSIIGMDNTSKTKTGRISDADRNTLSVTLFNKSGILLYAQIGDLDRDEIQSCMSLEKNKKYLLFPYSRSFYRKDTYPENGPAIKIFIARPEANIKNISLLINDDSEIKFGDTAYITYDNNKFNFTRDNTNNHNTEHIEKPSKTLPIRKRNSTK